MAFALLLRPAWGFPPTSPVAAHRSRSMFQDCWPVLCQKVWQFAVRSYRPRQSFLYLALPRANACLQFSRSQTSSINCSPMAGLSVPRFAASDSVPSMRPFGASPLYSSSKASFSSLFCPPVAHESRRFLAAPIHPVRGPFVLNPGQTADLPR